MAKNQNGVLWELLFDTVTCLSIALSVLSDSSKLTKTSCPDDFSLQSTLPKFFECMMVRLPDDTMLQTVPKIFSTPAFHPGNILDEHIICRVPDCGKNLCINGCCEETMVGYKCHCSSGFRGRHCDEQSFIETTKPATSPTATMPERSDAMTSQETTTSSGYTCSSPPVEHEYGGSFYNFSTCEMNHASAVSACSHYGSHLVFIESQEEQDFIVGGATADYYWIGLGNSSLRKARWLDGSNVTYSQLKKYSFNDNGICFRISLVHGNNWLDKECSEQYRYICEKEVGI